MNHTYRLVFNAALGTVVPVPESAHGTGKGRPGSGRTGELRTGSVPGALTRTALVLALAAAVPAQAQTWTGATGNYHDAANWSPGIVPNTSAATAVFGSTGSTNVNITSNLDVGTFQFNSGAPAYTFNVDNTDLLFSGSGIVNNAATTPVINITRLAGAPSLQFRNNASAGNAMITATDATVLFSGNATAGGATIHSNANINFTGDARGGTATISSSNGSSFVNVDDTADLEAAAVNLTGSTLRFRGSGSGGQAAVTLADGAQLQFFNYSAAGTTIGSLAGNGTVQLVDNNGNPHYLAIGGNNQSTTFSGTITGAGSYIVKQGTGTLRLENANTYTSGTTLSAGTVEIADPSALGTGQVTFAGGALRVDTSGTVTNTFLFEQDHESTLSVAAGQTVQFTGSMVSYADVMRFGSATDTGTIVLTPSTYTIGLGGDGEFPALVVAGGTLRVNPQFGFSTAGAPSLTVEAGATFDFNGYSGATIRNLQGSGTVRNTANTTVYAGDFAGEIAGSGALTKSSSGHLVLTGDNTYTGGTFIQAGTLQVGDGGTSGNLGSGDIVNEGALSFDRSDTISVAGSIGGTGTLTQAGSGNLVLTGTNTYTGGTLVNAGTLSVNGSIVGNTTVNSGGTLGGTGSVGNARIGSGGALAPGNSIGTLTVNGNLTFEAGSIYRVEVDAAGEADRVNTTGGGTITIDGGTVDVQAGGGGYKRNTRYTILRSGGATTGRFDNATTNLAFLTPTLIYEADGVLLNLEASASADYASAARTPNQRAVANYLQGFADAPGNAQAAGLIQQIDNLTADQAAAAFESMAGSAHASASQVASALGRNFSAMLAARSGFGTGGLGNAMNDWSRTHYASLAPVAMPSDSAQERGLWVQALGAGGSLDADGNAAGSRYGSSGFVLGYDQPVSGRWTAGAAAGYSSSRWNATSGDAASGKIESPQAGVYARYAGDNVRVRIDGTFARHDFTTDRTIEIAGVGSVANSKHKGREWGLAAQVEMPIQAGNWELRPLAGVRHAHLKEDGFSETGPNAANLAVAERTTRNTLLSAGMHFVRPFDQGRGGIELRAVASHLAGDNDSPVTGSIAGQPGTFTASGVPLKRDALTLGATVSGEVARNVSAFLDANYETRGSGQDAWRLTGGVRVRF